MMAPSEETLMAYADEQLSPSASDALARYLTRNGEAAAMVLMYRQTAILLKLAFERPLWEPAVDHLPAETRLGWWQPLSRLEFLTRLQVPRWQRALPAPRKWKKCNETAN